MQRLGMRYDGVFDAPARRRPATGGRPHVLYRVDGGRPCAAD